MTRPDTRADVERHLPLHPEAFRILLVLRGRESHGYAIVKDLERDPGRPGRVLPANLYRRIRTLSEQGLIEEAEGPGEGQDDDERRRYFRVTRLGEAVARAEALRLEGLLAGARDLLG
jgi:DNA-binding PadR family transcriptional regulator